MNYSHGDKRALGKRAPEYTAWVNMIGRCENPRNPKYARYGGRGIAVCARWRESYEAFLADVGRRPSAKHSLDRIENAKGYEPGNCRWATAHEQARNRRDNRALTFDGQTLLLAEWAERLGVPAQRIWTRLWRGWSVERALSTPFKLRPHGSRP